MGMIDADDPWAYDMWDYQTRKNKEWSDKVWDRFLRIYKHKYGVEWKPKKNLK